VKPPRHGHPASRRVVQFLSEILSVHEFKSRSTRPLALDADMSRFLP
jgi:hypothetical protein